MLTSTSEYLNALRKRNYLLFLEWPDFIIQKYASAEEELGADETINCLIFEWNLHGYLEDDAIKLALLQAVYDIEPKPLQGKLDYSFKTIVVALFFCMVLKKQKIQLVAMEFPQATCHDINRLIEERSIQLNQSLHQNSFDTVQEQFFQWVDGLKKHEVELVFQQVYKVTRPRYLLEDYILHLERLRRDHDELYHTRLSMARCFLAYLYEQMEWTPDMASHIIHYTQALRELNPNTWEEECFDIISPPSTLDNTWRWVRGLGIGFFNSVLHQKSLGDLISGQSEVPRV